MPNSHSDAAQHRLDGQQQPHQAELDGMAQAAQLKARENERLAMAARPMTALEMAHEHLARHPEDTEKVMALFLEHERAVLERQDERARENTEFIKFMSRSDVVQPGNLPTFVEAAAQQAGGPGPAGALGAPTAGTRNQPAALPRPEASAPDAGARSKRVVLERDPATEVWAPAGGVQPVYLLVDESSGAGPCLDAIAAGLGRVVEALRRVPDIAPVLRLSVLGFADRALPRLAMGAVDARSRLGWMTTRGGASYANAFETLYSRITPDVEGLEQQQLSVRRPLVFFLAAAAPVDRAVWRTPYQRLVDPAGHRYAPRITACGVGDADAELIAAIATQPETAYVMVPGTDVPTAIENYWQTLTRSLIEYGRSLIGGRPDFTFELPEGFQPARPAR